MKKKIDIEAFIKNNQQARHDPEYIPDYMVLEKLQDIYQHTLEIVNKDCSIHQLDEQIQYFTRLEDLTLERCELNYFKPVLAMAVHTVNLEGNRIESIDFE